MKPSTELIQLVNHCLDQSLTPVERTRLEELLQEDDALQYYLEMTDMEVSIPFELKHSSQTVAAGSRGAKSRWLPLLRMAAVIAISFCLGLLYNHKFTQPATSPLVKVAPSAAAPELAQDAASITGLIGVDWEGQAPDSLKLDHRSQSIRMKSGLMELTFASGVRTLIEGPAEIRVTGGNEAHMAMGRMVANVPKGAEGFTVSYQGGKIIDLGTEFALYIPSHPAEVEIGVFRGEVEVYSDDQSTPKKIIEDHAVAHGIHSGASFESIPFHRGNYVRSLPSREFPWQLPKAASTEPVTMEFDVSHLVWASGDYRAVIKWMKGRHTLVIEQAELLLDGEMIASDTHQGRTGKISRTFANTYIFSVPADQHRKGKWTLRVRAHADATATGGPGSFTPDSSGLLLFEGQQAIDATDAAFLGTWKYLHNGNIHERTFTADHRAQYTRNGEPQSNYDGATWQVEAGILVLDIPATASNGERTDLQERHLLRNDDELIFVNRPYRNAKKVTTPAMASLPGS